MTSLPPFILKALFLGGPLSFSLLCPRSDPVLLTLEHRAPVSLGMGGQESGMPVHVCVHICPWTCASVCTGVSWHGESMWRHDGPFLGSGGQGLELSQAVVVGQQRQILSCLI